MSATPATGSRLAAVRSTGIYSSLEHWRGVAALWVLFFHALGGESRTLHPWLEALKIPARPGWLGVHLFFVISGYCIAANVQSLRAKNLGALDFLRDRFLRILPTYWAAFAVTILLAAVTARFNHAPSVDNYPVGIRGWVGNLLLIQPYLEVKDYVIVYWTLTIELGFYLIVALIFAMTRASTRLAVGLILTLALVAVWVPPWPKALVVACWPEFVCGLLVFYAVQANSHGDRRRCGQCLGMIVLLGILGVLADHFAPAVSHSPKQLPFAATFALLLWGLYPLDAVINGQRALRWLSACGLFSYSLYLLHVPFGIRVYGLGTRFIPLTSPLYGLLVACFCVASLVVSYVFYRVFEVRFERWRRRFKVRPQSAVA